MGGRAQMEEIAFAAGPGAARDIFIFVEKTHVNRPNATRNPGTREGYKRGGARNAQNAAGETPRWRDIKIPSVLLQQSQAASERTRANERRARDSFSARHLCDKLARVFT